MAEIPPPPDELPDGFSLSDDKRARSVEEHYQRLMELTEEIRESYQKLMDERTKLIRDLKRIERVLASGPRTIVLGAVGAVLGMALYHTTMIIAPNLAE